MLKGILYVGQSGALGSRGIALALGTTFLLDPAPANTQGHIKVRAGVLDAKEWQVLCLGLHGHVT